MCRHLGYLGSPRTLHELVYAPPHSLQVQSYAPKMTQGCLLNADGFGVGWYADGADRHPDEAGHPGGADPVRYRRAQPIWTDVSFAEVARVVRTGCAVAAVRSATLGFPADESGAQPFRAGPWLFSHNGLVKEFAAYETRLRELAHTALVEAPANPRPDPRLVAGAHGWAAVPDARAPLDSALLFAMAVGHWRRGASLGDGLAEVVTTTDDIAPSRLNLLAADGQALAATACGDTLFARRSPEGTLIASEPCDDAPDWQKIPDRSLVTADATGIRIHPL